MTGLNRAVGPVYGLPNTPEHQLVTAEQARTRLKAMAGVEQVLLVEADGECAGLLSLRIVPYLSQDTPYAGITELYIDPAHRRAGLGRCLVAEAERVARAHGCTLVHVNAWRDNVAVQAFYSAIGYEAVEIAYEKALLAARG